MTSSRARVALATSHIAPGRIAAILLAAAVLSAHEAPALPITYQGELLNAGTPVTGQVDITLRLGDSEFAGLLLQQVAIADVDVVNGLFTVQAEFNDFWFDGSERWLSLAVEGQSLTPRQRVTYAPLAIFSDRARIANTVQVPLTLIGETVVLEAYANASTGVGVRGVHLANTGTSPGILGQTNSQTVGAAGVLGEITSTSPGSVSAGVRGINRSTGGAGIGVYGSQDGSGWGVYGIAPSGRGVFGTTTSGTGVRGNSGSGVGMEATTTSGVALTALHNTSDTRAELGRTDYAVYAENLAVNGEGTGLYATGGRVGLHGQAPGDGFGIDLTRIGVQGTAGDFGGGAMHLFGVRGFGQAPAAGGGRFAYGVSGIAQSGSSSSTAYGVRGEAVGPGANWAGYFVGNVHVQGTLSKSNGAFMIDHPQDPENKLLSHSFVESPDMLNIYSGTAKLDSDGRVTITLPSYFDALNESCRYQLTPIGSAMRDLHVAQEVSANTFEIAGGTPNGKVSWQVSGVRKDPAALANAIVIEQDKPAHMRGKYLNPEAFGLDASHAMYGTSPTSPN
jgi:hypothetical protein